MPKTAHGWHAPRLARPHYGPTRNSRIPSDIVWDARIAEAYREMGWTVEARATDAAVPVPYWRIEPPKPKRDPKPKPERPVPFRAGRAADAATVAEWNERERREAQARFRRAQMEWIRRTSG